jgi:hypothetical protein
MFLDQEHKEAAKTEFYINLELQQPDISSLGMLHKIKVTIINDIELVIYGLRQTGLIGRFNCESTPSAHFEVTRK